VSSLEDFGKAGRAGISTRQFRAYLMGRMTVCIRQVMVKPAIE
jgi:hypothetical protein